LSSEDQDAMAELCLRRGPQGRIGARWEKSQRGDADTFSTSKEKPKRGRSG